MKKKNENRFDLNFEYIVDLDYDRTRYNCQCEDICRCSTISNARIVSCNNYRVTKHICDFYNLTSTIDQYCVDRIVSIYRLYDTNSYTINIGGGYYGEEIHGVYINESIATKINEHIQQIKSLSSLKDKVEYILKLEYGYLIDGLDGNWEIATVKKTQIKFGNREHYHKLDRIAIDSYSEYDLPRGIGIKNCDEIRLIDGYHRVSAGGDTFDMILLT